ncbi:MAG: HAMP domain-containing sensor histidine kinase [Patescibacteria group bacterium]
MCITVSFSVVVYSGVVRSTERALGNYERGIEQRFEVKFLPPPNNTQNLARLEMIKNVKANTTTLLFVVNIIILVVSGSISYFLAGITLEPIEKMLEKQKKFIADAAHELKTPLTSMKTQLEVGKKRNKFNTQESSKIIDSVIEDIDSLTVLTNKLLKASRYQTYDNKNGIEDFNIVEITNKVIEVMKQKATKQEINILSNFTQDEILLRADKGAIKELITILLDNAVKFNKRKGTVEISVSKQDKKVEIKVKDTGMGISEKDLPFVFDRFYKVDNSRTRKISDGYGLGLSIAKEIVDLHKGSISVKSKLGEGSTFLVALPIN